MSIVFTDRADAGRRLGALVAESGLDVGAVLGLARGGVPVAAEVARRVGAALDVLVVRKIGAPHHRELAVGAVAETGAIVWELGLLSQLGLDLAQMEGVVAGVRDEVRRQVSVYRGDRPADGWGSRAVVIVDDGLATGASAAVAVRAVRERLGPGQQVVVAVPVASVEAVRRLRREADDVVAIQAPKRFRAVSTWYDDFHQVTDDEVLAALGPS